MYPCALGDVAPDATPCAQILLTFGAWASGHTGRKQKLGGKFNYVEMATPVVVALSVVVHIVKHSDTDNRVWKVGREQMEQG